MAWKRVARSRSSCILFADSYLDAILVLSALAHLFMVFWVAFHFRTLEYGWLAGFVLAHLFLVDFAFQVSGHYFMHRPFFKSRHLNFLFGLLQSLCTARSHSNSWYIHMDHHRYGNDYVDPETGMAKDYSSTFIGGKDGQHASCWTYTFTSLPYCKPRRNFRRLVRYGRHLDYAAEVVTVWCFLIALAIIDWQFLMFYLPVIQLSYWVAVVQNYVEHWGAIPGSRMTDSVSCYGTLYNLVSFNNGYHQEHHYRASVHWLDLPRLRSELPPESERRVVKGWHLANLPLWAKEPPWGANGARKVVPEREPTVPESDFDELSLAGLEMDETARHQTLHR